MIAKSLRGIAAAFLIGTASVAVATVATVGVAQAAGVRAEVGKPLQEALSLAKAGKGSRGHGRGPQGRGRQAI